jgi:hypothetical protein
VIGPQPEHVVQALDALFGGLHRRRKKPPGRDVVRVLVDDLTQQAARAPLVARAQRLDAHTQAILIHTYSLCDEGEFHQVIAVQDRAQRRRIAADLRAWYTPARAGRCGPVFVR